MTATPDPVEAFIQVSQWHGPIEQAREILAAHPDLAQRDIHAAAILGDDDAVRAFIARDPASATAKGGPFGRDALSHLCFSKFLRLERDRTPGFVRAAEALLDAGASPNTGFMDRDHDGNESWESVLYGAAGVAFHPEVTRLLIARGADPNDGETPYHSPENDDNTALRIVVESGRLKPENLALMLLRKADWHDLEGAVWLMQHGADPNHSSGFRGNTALLQSIDRDNDRAIVAAMLDGGGDPTRVEGGRSGIVNAVRRGRRDLLDLFERRGIALHLTGVDRLIAACARDDVATVRTIAAQEPALVQELVAEGGTLLAQFAGTGNAAGLGHLLDLGADINARFTDRDGYWDLAQNTTALIVASWRAWHPAVMLLIARGAEIDARDSRGRTALMMAVRACVDSYWSYRRSPDSVAALLAAGASADLVPYPTGYAEVDALLAARRPTS